MSYFTGKTIWLVGASEGIGEALARKLAPECEHLILSARNEEKLQKLASDIPSGNASVLPVDVTDVETVRTAWAQFHRLDTLPDTVIYNAGTYTPMDALRFDLAKAEYMFDVNFNGALRVLSVVLPELVGRGAGHIALVASVAGYRGLPGAIGYGASKAALIHLAQNLRADLGQTGIKVQVINPGFVQTRLTALNDFPMPCIITPEKAAEYITGGLAGEAFEIHFPKRFSRALKFLSLLPDWLYFYLLRKRSKSREKA